MSSKLLPNYGAGRLSDHTSDAARARGRVDCGGPGALLAGVTADAFRLNVAKWLIAALTLGSGIVSATRMTETLPGKNATTTADGRDSRPAIQVRIHTSPPTGSGRSQQYAEDTLHLERPALRHRTQLQRPSPRGVVVQT